MSTEKTDQQLVQQARGGDLPSFDQLVRKYQGPVFGIAYHWTGDAAQAEDLVQDTFFVAFAQLDQLAAAAKFAPWIRAIAHNRCRMWKRGLRPGEVSLDAPGNSGLRGGLRHPDPLPTEQVEAAEDRGVVEEILGLLPDKARQAARLYYVDGLSYREICQQLAAPMSTVKARLHRAKQMLNGEEATHMAEQHFGKRGWAVQLDLREGEGFFHPHEDGYGFIRPAFDAAGAADDLYVSPTQRRSLNLRGGDYMHVAARPPKRDERYWAVLRINRINHRPIVLPVAGYLHIDERGCGFVRPQPDAGPDVRDAYVAPQQIRDYGLQAGDRVEATTHSRLPTPLSIHKVNGETVEREVAADEAGPAAAFTEAGIGGQVVELAREEARRLRHSYVGTEHLLLAVLKIRPPRASQVLHALDLNPGQLVQALDESASPSRDKAGDPLPFTPRARQVCAAALAEAEDWAFAPADAEHLLLALARDEEGVAGQTLVAFGAYYHSVSKALKALLDQRRIALTHEEDGARRISRFGNLLEIQTHRLDRPDPQRVLPLGGAAGILMNYMALHPELVRGRRVLEPFAGSGPLGLLAAKLGAAHVDMVDINPQAIEFQRANAARNGIDGGVYTPFATDIQVFAPAERYDAIFANPPFVPTPADFEGVIHSNGGVDGSRLAVALVERLEALLKPDGEALISLYQIENRDGPIIAPSLEAHLKSRPVELTRAVRKSADFQQLADTYAEILRDRPAVVEAWGRQLREAFGEALTLNSYVLHVGRRWERDTAVEIRDYDGSKYGPGFFGKTGGRLGEVARENVCSLL